jgi:hypothetical protein
LNTTGAVVKYVNDQDTAYLALAYAQSAADAAAAQANAYAKAESEADAAEQAAKDYADGKFLSKVKLNDSFLNVLSDETNGRYVDLGSIATSDSLQSLTDKVNAIEAAYITKTASEEADNAIITAYEAADAAIVTGYTQADAAIVSSYTAADSAIIASYTAADTALSNRIDALESSYEVTMTSTDGSDNILKVYTLSQGGTEIGKINIPKDLVATAGSLVYCTKSDDTYTETTADAAGAIACIKMTIQNGNPFYIEVADLIEYNTVKSNAEITLTDTGHQIEATVGTIAASKISYNDTTVDDAIADLYSQVGEGGSVSTQIQTAIEALDASYTASGTPAHNGTFVMNAVTQTDGKIASIGSVEVEAAGAAATVKTELLGDADTNNNTLGKLADRIDSLDGDVVKSVNGQDPDANGAVTINANQIDTVTTFKIGNEASATTHKVDEVLANAVLFEELSTSTNYADVNLTV